MNVIRGRGESNIDFRIVSSTMGASLNVITLCGQASAQTRFKDFGNSVPIKHQIQYAEGSG